MNRISPTTSHLGGTRVLGPFPETLSEKAKRSLEKLGVHVRTREPVRSVDRDGLTLERGNSLERLPSRTVIWAGGVTAALFGRFLAERTHADQKEIHATIFPKCPDFA